MKNLYLLIIVSILSDFALANDFELELNTGVESVIGIDGVETPVEFAPSLIKHFGVKKAKDYTKPVKNNNSNNTNTVISSNNNTTPNIFIPKEIENKKVGLLVSDYLYNSIQNKYYKNVSFKDKKYGLGLYVKANGKKIFVQDYTDITIGTSLNNKYIDADFKYVLNKDESKQYGIDRIYKKNEYKNKSFVYNLTLSPLKNKILSPNLTVSGVNKHAQIYPNLSLQKNNFYITVGPNFYTSKEMLNIGDEISNVYHAAPGYNKIEYFKDWTLKNTIPDLSKESAFLNEKADFKKAEVSGYKGTHRLLGSPSGSLYGESLIKFAVKEAIKELKNDGNFPNTVNLINKIENSNAVIVGFVFKINQIKQEFENKKAVNNIITKLSKTMLEKTNLEVENKSNTHILNITPKRIKEILPYLNPEYNLFESIDKYSLNYLYYGFSSPTKNNAVSTRAYSTRRANAYDLIEKDRNFTEDLNEYIIPSFENEYPTLITGKPSIFEIVTNIIPSIFTGDSKYLNILRNPDEIVGTELFSPLYFHYSEKDVNKQLLKSEMDSIKKDIANVANKKQSLSPGLLINTGYNKDDFKTNVRLSLLNKTNITANDFIFTKKNNNIGLSLNYNKNNFIVSSNIKADFSNYYLKNKNTLELDYSNYDFTTKNYLGYVFKPSSKFDIALGVNHLGTASYIKVNKMIKDGKEYTMDVSKRDENNNPIGLDGESIEVNKTTEKDLIDKVIAKDNKKIPLRTKQSDYLQKEEKALNSSWYNIYNIIAPSLNVTYNVTDNLSISNGIQIPIAIKDKRFSGINFVYKGNIRYLLSDDYIDIFTDLRKKYKFNTNGLIYLGYNTTNGLKTTLDTNIDIPFASLHIKSDSINDIRLKANTNVTNLPIKPLVIFEKNNEKKSLKYGLELQSKDIKARFGVGTSEKKEDKTYETIHNILSMHQTDDAKLFETKKYLFDDIKTTGNLSYIDLETNKDNYKFNANLEFKNIETNFNNTFSDKTENDLNLTFTDKDIEDLGDYNKTNIEYNLWAYTTKGNKFSGPWVYFVPLKLKDTIITKNSTFNFKNKNIKANLSFSMKNKVGFNFNSNLNLNYNYSNIQAKKTLNKTSYSKTNVYAINIKRGQKYIDVKDKFNDDNLVKVEKNVENKKYYEHINELITKNDGVHTYNKSYYKAYNFKDSDRDKVINRAKEGLEIKKEKELTIEEQFSTSINDIHLNLTNNIGYNHRLGSKAIIGLNLSHLLDLRYTKLNSVITNNFKLYGRDKLTIKNFITPEIKLEYSITDRLSLNMLNGLTFKFNNKKYEGMKYNFEAGVKYEW